MEINQGNLHPLRQFLQLQRKLPQHLTHQCSSRFPATCRTRPPYEMEQPKKWPSFTKKCVKHVGTSWSLWSCVLGKKRCKKMPQLGILPKSLVVDLLLHATRAARRVEFGSIDVVVVHGWGNEKRQDRWWIQIQERLDQLGKSVLETRRVERLVGKGETCLQSEMTTACRNAPLNFEPA